MRKRLIVIFSMVAMLASCSAWSAAEEVMAVVPPLVDIDLPPRQAAPATPPMEGNLEAVTPADENTDENVQQAAPTEQPEMFQVLEPTAAPAPSPSPYTTITISAAGDTTLGGDPRWRGYHQFMRIYEENGVEFFLQNVRDIFAADDLTILNLEGALTYAEEHMDKPFAFRGPPHFAQILSTAYVDVVTIANNHTIDFFDIGYRDTIAALEAEGIAYFGNEFNTIMEINGINVGLFGFRIWGDYSGNRSRITAAINDLQERGAQLIIAYHHWGVENSNMPEQYQRNIGRFTIDQGAHLVLGAHPHVLQGIEVHNGRNIVYSLGNFSFGGNAHPPDFDTMIFQQTFTFYNGGLLDTNDTNIIPAHISSTRAYNNFQPTPAEGDEAERILGRIETFSRWLE